MRIGILSDTHGVLPAKAVERLEGCERILHAGDVGDTSILDRLGQIAPVTAVRGNVDVAGPLANLPFTVTGELDGVRFRMIHRREDLEARWRGQADLIVFGHSHRPELDWQASCLLLNPGACGQRRFRLPLTLAVLTILDHRIIPQILSVE